MTCQTGARSQTPHCLKSAKVKPMNAVLRNFLLSTALIALPAMGFVVAENLLLPRTGWGSDSGPVSSDLGDLSSYRTIVSDTQAIANTGDLVAAEKRITELEDLWDQNAAVLRKAAPAAWSTVDGAADEAFSALRARTPDPARVRDTLVGLTASLDSPLPAASGGPAQQVAGIDVTDAFGHALPCEEMAAKLRAALAGATPSAEVGDLQGKALERCNADDDARSDGFAAQALSLIKG
jgi:hypothetical protein